MTPYASHLPVLRAVLETYAPKRVLELGTGDHSTPLFLSAGVKLTALETSRRWYDRARGLGDFDLRLVPEIAGNIPPLDDFDLVFVDDSDTLKRRARTLRAVLSQPHPLTVIHDAEVPEYRRIIRELSSALIVCATKPHTAVAYPPDFPRRYSDIRAAIDKEMSQCES